MDILASVLLTIQVVTRASPNESSPHKVKAMDSTRYATINQCASCYVQIQVAPIATPTSGPWPSTFTLIFRYWPTSTRSDLEFSLLASHHLSCAAGDKNAAEIETGERFNDAPYKRCGA